MTATFKKTPILFAALLTVATPAFAGDWRTTPGGTDGLHAVQSELGMHGKRPDFSRLFCK